MMDLLLRVLEHPYESIAVLLSLWAGLAIFIFLAGLGAGSRQLTHIDMNDEELEQSRTNAVWGVTQLIFLFLLWEAVQVVYGLIYGTVTATFAYTIAAIWLFIISSYMLRQKLKKKEE